MSGFAVNLGLLHSKPNAEIPYRRATIEDGFLRSLEVELEDLEPLAEGCTQVRPVKPLFAMS